MPFLKLNEIGYESSLENIKHILRKQNCYSIDDVTIIHSSLFSLENSLKENENLKEEIEKLKKEIEKLKNRS